MLHDMAQACGKRPVAQLAIDEGDIKAGHGQAKIDDFTRQIQATLRPGTPSLDVA